MDLGSLVYGTGSAVIVCLVAASASGGRREAASLVLLGFVLCVASMLWIFDVWRLGAAWYAGLALPPLLLLAAGVGLRGSPAPAGRVWQSMMRRKRVLASMVGLWGSR